MGKTANYVCTECKQPTPREGLVVKKITFTEMGESSRTIRTRVAQWLCATCLARDEYYNQPAYSGPYSSED